MAVLNEWSHTHNVELFLPKGSSSEIFNLVARGVKVDPPHGTQRTPPRPIHLLWTLFRVWVAAWYVLPRAGHWDVVIASSHYGFDVLPMLLARNCRYRSVYWWHHATAPHGRPAWAHGLIRLSEALLACFLRKGTVFVFTGNSTSRAWLESKGVNPRKIALTMNGTSISETPASDGDVFEREPMLKRLSGRKLVLFCARLSNLKGAGDLPSICPSVLMWDPNAAIVICGAEGPESPAVHRALEQYESSGAVTFLGFVSERAKKWLFEHAHVLMTPSYEEGWGGAVADGLSSGCWVVSYDVAAVRESNPDGPIFVPVGDVQLFASEIVSCLAQPRPSPEGAVQTAEWARIAQHDLRSITGEAIV